MHILFQCNFSKDVWRAVGLLEMIVAEDGGTVLVGIISWSLWNRRNKWLWKSCEYVSVWNFNSSNEFIE